MKFFLFVHKNMCRVCVEAPRSPQIRNKKNINTFWLKKKAPYLELYLLLIILLTNFCVCGGGGGGVYCCLSICLSYSLSVCLLVMCLFLSRRCL